MHEPLDRNEAVKLIQEIRTNGSITVSGHAKKELAKDKMTSVDAINVLRCGRILDEPEYENGSYRYRVGTPFMMVVVAFRSETELVIVTAWRKQR